MTRKNEKATNDVDVPKARKSPAKATKKVAKAAEKEKHVRGRFSIPASDYELIARIKAMSKKNGRSIKKNDVLRAGLRALGAMDEDELAGALHAVKPPKPIKSEKNTSKR